MVNVIFGSARIDERGKTTGGVAGDQTGKEVSTQNWYLHSKGWRVFRAISAAVAEAIAICMAAACANDLIGYDQNQRNDLYNAAKLLGFDVRLIKTAVETDCSALIRVCLAFAGIMVGDFNTATEASVLLASGAFYELTDSKYTKQPDYLRRGDILVTKTKGHTGVILTNGSKAGALVVSTVYKLGDRILKNGMDGADVKELQGRLIQQGYSCGSWGADGDFGDATELAVRKFQRDHGCGVDGEVGPETLGMLMNLSSAEELPTPPAVTPGSTLGNRTLKRGMTGADVRDLQNLLIQLGYSCGDWGADGDFGSGTLQAVKQFQRDHGCGVDGEVGPETLGALMSALGVGDGETATRTVQIVGGQCYIRETPDKVSGKILGVAKEGSTFTYTGEQSTDGWLRIVHNDAGGWVSGMYGKLVA